MNKIIIIIALIGVLVVSGCEKSKERFVESCDECKDEERCVYYTSGNISCRIETEEKKQRTMDIEQNIKNYQCYNGCSNFHGEEWITNKVCDCYNENNVSYNVEFVCGAIENCFLTFEDKKKMAMIDDHWYCICNEKVEGYYCEVEYKEETGCFDRNVENKKFDRVTEFVWSY